MTFDATFSAWQAAKESREARETSLLSFYTHIVFFEGGAEAPPCVGGDPSAGSPTDTLLRLNLPC